MGGREYVVADAVILKVQVLNGSDGPLFYPLVEINQDVGVWNGYPLTAKHPQVVLPDGRLVSVSARIPKIAHAYQIGTVYNDRMVGEERWVEVWFDVQNSDRIDKRIVPAVLAGKQINVSTGIFTGKIVENSVHNGVNYTHRVRGIKPDHLAVLMDEKGACSTDDGCGINVNAMKNMGAEIASLTGTKQLTSPMLDDGLHHHFIASDPETAARTAAKKLGAEAEVGNEKGIWTVSVMMTGKMHMFHFLPPTTPTENAMYPKTCPECGGAVNASTGKCDKCGMQTKKMTANQQQIIEYLVTNCECWKGDKGKVLNAMDEPTLIAVKADAEKAVANSQSLTFTVNALKEIKGVVKAPEDAKVSDVVALVKTNTEKAAVTIATPTPTPGVISNETIIAAIKTMPEAEILKLLPTVNKTVETAKGVIDEKRYAIMNQLVASEPDAEKKKAKLLKLKDKDLPTLNEYLEFAVSNGAPTPPPPANENEAFLRNFFASVGTPIVPAPAANGNSPAGSVALKGAATPITANFENVLQHNSGYDPINDD